MAPHTIVIIPNVARGNPWQLLDFTFDIRRSSVDLPVAGNVPIDYPLSAISK